MEYTIGLLRLVFLFIIVLFFLEVLRILNRNMEQDEKKIKEKSRKKAYLAVVEGGKFIGVENGRRFNVAGKCAMGRNRENSIVIEDPFASAFHAVVINKNNRFLLSDLDSKNGTLLNGKPIKKDARLKTGDLIQIGDVSLKFEIE